MKRKLAVLSAVAALTAAANVHAAVFENFNTSVGTFNQLPGFSGTSAGFDKTSSPRTDTVVLDATSPLEGAKSLKMQVVGNGTTPFRIRFVSNSGTPTAANSFSVTAGTDGFLGFYYKASNLPANTTIAPYIDDSSNTSAGLDSGKTKVMVADGAWHLAEWNLDLATDWVVAAGIGGDGVLQSGTRSFDSIAIFGPSGGSLGTGVTATVWLDFIALNPSGSIANLLTVPASVSLSSAATKTVIGTVTVGTAAAPSGSPTAGSLAINGINNDPGTFYSLLDLAGTGNLNQLKTDLLASLPGGSTVDLNPATPDWAAGMGVANWEVLISTPNPTSPTGNDFMNLDLGTSGFTIAHVAAVPEPTTLTLAGMSALGLIARRRRA